MSNIVRLGNPYAGAKAPQTGGDVLSRMMNHYAKEPQLGHDGMPKPAAPTPGFTAAGLGPAGPVAATTPPKAPKAAVRDPAGGIKTHPRQGGLGPGRLGGYGSGRGYPKAVD